MPFYVHDNGQEDFERMEPGLKAAVCSHVVDMGVQVSMYGEQEKLMVCFEFAEKMKDGRPYMLSKEYTKSLNVKANLRKDLETWRGKPFTLEELGVNPDGSRNPDLPGFDVESIIGANAMISVIDNPSKKDPTKIYSQIANINPPMKGTPTLVRSAQPVPEWIQKKSQQGIAFRNAAGFVDTVPPPQEMAAQPMQAPAPVQQPVQQPVSQNLQPVTPPPPADDDLPF